MADFTPTQQARLDATTRRLFIAIDALQAEVSELRRAFEAVRTILAFEKRVAVMENPDSRARKTLFAADLLKLDDLMRQLDLPRRPAPPRGDYRADIV